MIGRGGFGTVHKVMHLERGKTCALKATPLYILDNPSIREKLKHEVELQKTLNHPNIVKAYDKFEDEFNYYIVLELCPHASVKALFTRRGSFTEPEAADVIGQVLRGLVYLHEKRIVHRDLKLENFLIGRSGKVKIADFGISVKLNDTDEKRHSFCGTIAYMSPEMLNGTHDHGYEVDMWALGVATFTLLTGKHPFAKQTKETTYAHIKTCTYRFPPEKKLSFIARDFVELLLQKDPNQRPRAAELLNHPFLALPRRARESPLLAMLNQQNCRLEASFSMEAPATPKSGSVAPKRENTAENVTSVQEGQSVPEYCVARYSDKVAKYGLGYMLANGCVGAIFPDQSRMIMDPFREFVQYWPNYRSHSPVVYRVADCPETKKLSIIMKFLKAMASTPVTRPRERPSPSVPLHHIKYWSKSNDAILFRTDNRVMQVNFADKEKLIIFWNTKRVMSITNVKDKAPAVPFDSVSAGSSTKQKLMQAIRMIQVMEL